MCRHREIKDSLCPHRAHGLGRENKHGNGNYNTVSNKHKDEKKPQEAQKREPEKKAQRNPKVLRKKKAEAETHRSAWRESKRRESTDVLACTHMPTPLLCRSTEEDPFPGSPPSRPQAFSCKDGGWGLGMAKLSP